MIDSRTLCGNPISRKTTVKGGCIVNEFEKKMVEEVKSISARGNSAEVKRDKDGKYIVYEVQKKKKMVG